MHSKSQISRYIKPRRKTATLDITKIDKNAPTVSAKQSTLTITQGDSYAISNYFTTSSNGNAPITNTTYSVTNTNSLGVGNHTVTCTATKATGLTASASMTIVVNSNKPAYTEKSWTTAGTYSWMCPNGVTRIRLAMVRRY